MSIFAISSLTLLLKGWSDPVYLLLKYKKTHHLQNRLSQYVRIPSFSNSWIIDIKSLGSSRFHSNMQWWSEWRIVLAKKVKCPPKISLDNLKIIISIQVQISHSSPSIPGNWSCLVNFSMKIMLTFTTKNYKSGVLNQISNAPILTITIFNSLVKTFKKSILSPTSTFVKNILLITFSS